MSRSQRVELYSQRCRTRRDSRDSRRRNAPDPKLVTMFGGTDFSLTMRPDTRYFCGGGAEQPDANSGPHPGFEGGANFKILAENRL